MAKEKHKTHVTDAQLGDICDEGGSHVFDKVATPCHYCLAISCCPCYIFLSLIMSQSAAFANPVLEQCTGSKKRREGEEATCIKCGLTRAEAQNLNEVRRTEAQAGAPGSAPGYFSSQMKVPAGVA